MTDPAIDRRSRRTRQKLHAALADLLTRRPYARIRVEQICERAGVGRSTFYAHFADKDDVKRHGLDHLAAALDAAGRQIDRPYAFCEVLFSHAAERRELVCALRGGRGDVVSRERLAAIVGEAMRREFARNSGAKGDEPLRVAGATGALLAMLDWWLADGCRQTPQDLADDFRTIADSGFSRGGST